MFSSAACVVSSGMGLSGTTGKLWYSQKLMVCATPSSVTTKSFLVSPVTGLPALSLTDTSSTTSRTVSCSVGTSLDPAGLFAPVNCAPPVPNPIAAPTTPPPPATHNPPPPLPPSSRPEHRGFSAMRSGETPAFAFALVLEPGISSLIAHPSPPTVRNQQLTTALKTSSATSPSYSAFRL